MVTIAMLSRSSTSTVITGLLTGRLSDCAKRPAEHFRVLDVSAGIRRHRILTLFFEDPLFFSGDPHDERAGGDLGAFSDHSTCRNHGAITNGRARQDDRSHSDCDAVAY